MRFINTIGYNPRKWSVESQKKHLAMRLTADKKAFLDIPANKTWNWHKEAFERLSHNKCWFSEAYASVSDFEIEHFRPKKRVHLIRSKDNYPERRTATDINGYWWLSYELENLRLAGSKPNQFKGNYFPLETNSTIATQLNNSWRKEIPILLDPCKREDAGLITYDGVEPKEANLDPATLEHIRARISIKVYGLKINKLKIARSRVYEEAKNYYENSLSNWTVMNQGGITPAVYDLARRNFERNCRNLVSMLLPYKEFTRMVLAFLIAANQEWVQHYVIDIATGMGYI
jgi:hypothetical protein